MVAGESPLKYLLVVLLKGGRDAEMEEGEDEAQTGGQQFPSRVLPS